MSKPVSARLTLCLATRRCLRNGGAVVLLALLGACETTPPVQEMSDARQAIAVARDAGAEAYAKVQLQDALRHLESAEHELSSEEYKAARRDALLAKAKALEARDMSKSVQQQQ
ncbi:MAG TPA: DUF4398 domain-containing protein [Woeseiaceae bacterium]|nr:DUF4398 domain-containing protein [Woeseiaceae bacterium]